MKIFLYSIIKFISNNKLIILDKSTQSLINIIPFVSALFFIKLDYQKYYLLLSFIMLFVTFGNLGIDKLITSNKINIFKTLKIISISRVFSAFFFFFIISFFFEYSLFQRIIGSLIVLVYYSSFFEFLYIGSHINSINIKIKLLILITGFLSRILFSSIDDFLLILLVESILFSLLIIFSLNKKSANFLEKTTIKFVNYFHSLLLVIIAFLVNKVYLFYLPKDFSQSDLKLLHLFDYLVVLSSIAGNIIVKSKIEINLSKLITPIFIFFSISYMVLLLVNYSMPLFYILAKIASAVNVFIIYMILNKLNTKLALMINISSLVIIITFITLINFINISIFTWMFAAEFSVLISFYFYNFKNKLA